MIEKRQRRGRNGKAYHVYRVRWYDDDGVEQNKTLPRGTRREEAEAFERKVMTLKRTGELPALEAGRVTLADFIAEEWWPTYAGPNLERATLVRYAQVWNTHGLRRVGHYRLRELNPEIFARLRVDLERDGVGEATVRKLLTMLQGALARAVEWQRMTTNPVAAVRKPRAKRKRQVVVVPPLKVEELRDVIRARDAEGRGHRDATLISVLAYVGPRPWSEAVRLTWDDVGVVLRVYATKTRRERSPALVAPVRADLREWRLASGRPPGNALVFPAVNGAWSESDVRNWRRRVWQPALEECGLPTGKTGGMVPYDLRHCRASLMIHEGRAITEIAEELGHAPSMTLDTYGHVIRELKDQPRIPAEQQIREARDKRAAARAAGGAR